MRALAPALTIDSAGTHDYHVGEAPDPRTQHIAMLRGYDLSPLRARKVTLRDFTTFDVILAMDAGHYDYLARLKPKNATATLALFCEYAGLGKQDVPDPYYGSAKDFEACFELIEEACKNIAFPKAEAILVHTHLH